MTAVSTGTGIKKRVHPVVWEKIRREYEIGGLSYNQLADRYGINRSSIKRKADRQGWNQQNVQQLITSSIVEDAGLTRLKADISKIVKEMEAPPKAATEYGRNVLSVAEQRKRIRDSVLDGAEGTLEALNALRDDVLIEWKRVRDSDGLKMCPELQLLLDVMDLQSLVMLRMSRAVFGCGIWLRYLALVACHSLTISQPVQIRGKC